MLEVIGNSTPFNPADKNELAGFIALDASDQMIPNNDFTRELLDILTAKVAEIIFSMQKDLRSDTSPAFAPVSNTTLSLLEMEVLDLQHDFSCRLIPLFCSATGSKLLENEAFSSGLFKASDLPLEAIIQKNMNFLNYNQKEVIAAARLFAEYLVVRLLIDGKRYTPNSKRFNPESNSDSSPIKSKMRVLHVNGMCTSEGDAQEQGRIISQMLDGRPVKVIHSHTHLVQRSPLANALPTTTYVKISELLTDLFVAVAANRGYPTDGVKKVRREIIHFYFVSDPHDRLLIVTHSRGAIETRTALLSGLPKPMLNKVMTLNVAPGAFIEKGACEDSQHLVSSLDIVPMLAIQDKSKADVTELEGQSWKMEDHSFASPIYKEELEQRLKKIRDEYESFD